jgi:hypothetical protein
VMSPLLSGTDSPEFARSAEPGMLRGALCRDGRTVCTVCTVHDGNAGVVIRAAGAPGRPFRAEAAGDGRRQAETGGKKPFP